MNYKLCQAMQCKLVSDYIKIIEINFCKVKILWITLLTHFYLANWCQKLPSTSIFVEKNKHNFISLPQLAIQERHSMTQPYNLDCVEFYLRPIPSIWHQCVLHSILLRTTCCFTKKCNSPNQIFTQFILIL